MPGLPRFLEERPDGRTTLGKCIFHAAAYALEQRRHIQEVVRRRETNLIRQLVQVRRERQSCFTHKAGKQKQPRSRKIERQVMKNPVRSGAGRGHQLLKALRCSREHKVQISDVEAYALRLARGPGSVNDRDDVGIRPR